MNTNVANLKQQVEEAIAKFAEQLDWSNFSADTTTMGQYFEQILAERKEGLAYQVFNVKHKTKRGYSPKTIRYRKLLGYYDTEVITGDDGNLIINHYIRPILVAVERINIKMEVLNEGTKTV